MIEGILENNLIYTEKKIIGVTESLTTSVYFLGQFY